MAHRKDILPQGRIWIDLHLHADGAISVPTARKLASMQGMELPCDDTVLFEQLTAPRHCRDLNEYLERFALPCSLMQTKDTVSEAFFSIQEELKEKDLLYAELRFAPQLHTLRGLTQAEVVEAALEGMARSVLKSNLILCCMRGDANEKENLETVRLAKEYAGRGVVAVDLAGAEALYPTENFKELFTHAKALGIPFTIHAGEAAGAESVAAALDLGAARIGHGVHSMEDTKVIQRLKASGIPLELCITSNLQTKAEKELASYPLRKLMAHGITVTLNTDNPTVSHTSIRREWELAAEAFSLTREEIQSILLDSVRVSFADAETKADLRSELQRAFCRG